MRSKLITVVPVYNAAQFVVQTLESVAAQTLKPDRVIVQDNGSTDNTEELVRNFKPITCEWRRNEKNLGWIGNFNRGLEFARETRFLHILCADDVIKPSFYERLTKPLEDCPGIGLAYCLDERIDENNQRLSISGKVTGQVETQPREAFLKEKAEIANQAASASLLKTEYQPPVRLFRPEFPSLADMIFWAEWGASSEKIVRVHEPLAQFRWHGANNSSTFMPSLQSLVLDEWRGMQMIEQMRRATPGFIRQFKLKGLYAVRSGIKAKRFREQNNPAYAEQIVREVRKTTGNLAWWLAQAVVETRDIYVYRLLGRPKHPKNVYS